MRCKFFILMGILLLLVSCRGKEDPSPSYEPVLTLELLEVKASQVSVQVKSMDVSSITYGVGKSETEAMVMPSSARTPSEGLASFRLEVGSLEPETSYVLCVRGIGPGGEKGEIKSLSFTTTAVPGSLYPWEKARSGAPSLPDMTLIPGPSSHRNPLEWSRDRWYKHVCYKDEDGREHWFFDSFLLIEGQQTGQYGSKGYTYVLTEQPTPSAPREQWQQLLDFWFDGGTFDWQESWWGNGTDTFGRWYSGRMVTPSPVFSEGQLSALDACISDVASRIGEPPTKRYIVMALPEPIYFDNYIEAVNSGSGNTRYWGSLDGREMDFSKVEDRVAACKWYINCTRAAFARKNYRNIELAGFYILPEILDLNWRKEYKNYDVVVPEIARFLHECNEGLYWIPYNMAPGYDLWKDTFNIDVAYMQPNYYWDETGKNPLDATFREINAHGMGVELEFEYSMVEAVNGSVSAAKYRRRFEEYLDWTKSSGVYGSRSIALYSGTDAMEQLADSPLPGDREMYHKLGHFIIDSPLKR